MRTIHPMLITVVLQCLVWAGCAGSSDPATTSASAPSAVSLAVTPVSPLICGKNEHVCSSCDGTRQFCAEFCPDCIPAVHAPVLTTPADLAALTCSPPLRSCVSCDGTTHFCSRVCPECAPPLAPGTDSAPATLALGGLGCPSAI